MFIETTAFNDYRKMNRTPPIDTLRQDTSLSVSHHFEGAVTIPPDLALSYFLYSVVERHVLYGGFLGFFGWRNKSATVHAMESKVNAITFGNLPGTGKLFAIVPPKEIITEKEIL